MRPSFLISRRWTALVMVFGLAAPMALSGCASAVNPCKDEYGGLCTSPREMYGVTRNRDQVNPTKEVLANQKKAGVLINTPPAPSENLPSISPGKSSTPDKKDLLPSSVLKNEGTGDPGGVVNVQGPYATDSFGGQNTPLPLLRQPKVLRVWIAPYIGQDNNLHFPGYVYTVIQPGTWTFGASSEGAQPPMPSPAQVRASNEGK